MLNDIFVNWQAYLPPRSTLWLWIGGPLIVLLTYFLTTRSSKERKKRLREAEIWRGSVGPERVHAEDDNKKGAPFRPDPSKKKAPVKVRDAGPPRVVAIPGALQGAVYLVGAGEMIGHYQLARDLAYLTLVEANVTAGSDYQTVSGKLEERAPSLTVRPLPRVDGVPVPNTGVQFKKDPDLMNLFLIEGPDAKAIGKWLSPPIRRALCELPTAWIRVEGTAMTVSVFGALEADGIDKLVELADTIFAEHGAGGGPSLFGDDDGPAQSAPPPPKAAKPKKKKEGTSTVSTSAETPMSKRKG